MKSFLLKFSLFFLGFLIIFSILGILASQKDYDNMKISNDITTVFIGDSTMAYSFNDSLYFNSYNIGRGSETPDWMYGKLKILKKHNPRIDTVFLPINDIALNRKGHATRYDFVHFIGFTPDEILLHTYDYLLAENYSHSIKTSFELNHILNSLQYITQPGERENKKTGYTPLKDNKLQYDLEMNKSKDLIKKNQNAGYTNLKYYRKIIDFCKAQNITLFFVTAPIYPDLWSILEYRSLYEKYLNDVVLIDCSHWIYPDSCYRDAIHLNNYGADLFTKDFYNFIKTNYK